MLTQHSIKEYPLEVCCPDWQSAMNKGTDNEGYGPLIYYVVATGHYRMGQSLKPVKFCPWCGEEKP